MTRANPRPRAPRPTGGSRLPFEVAPALSVVGLVVVAIVSFSLLGGSLPSISGPGGPNDPGGPIRTATPSNVVVVPNDPRTKIPGSLLYVKDGNIWVQSGDKARQLTTGGADAMPAWSPDGASIYFVRVSDATGKWPSAGVIRTYNLSVPSLMRIKADGSGQPEILLTGNVKKGSNTWSYFIREPSIAPDGLSAAIITDGPDPTRSDIVVKFLDFADGSISDPNLGEIQSLGHQDPAWSPDGKTLLYVRNAREGSRGTPAIYRYSVATKKSTELTGPGYTAPAWSRDGRFVAATQTTSFGTDVVILDAKTGAELLRVTQDESSFSPVWSPKGDAVAFYRVDYGVVDLYLVPLQGTAPTWTAGDPLALTISAGLEADSRPTWFIPADQLPPLPTPTPVTTAAPALPTSTTR
ncbi:MAG: PD40 domain-containing protein [Chloroflexi bacterium]|nr:PD40 domain-containing protein [Chloroflexota bacterium]